MDQEMYSIFATSTPKILINNHRLNSVDNATPGRPRAKSATNPRRVLLDMTNKLPNEYFQCHLSPKSGCDKIPNQNLPLFSEFKSNQSSQSSCKKFLSYVCSPLKELAICQSPQPNCKRTLSSSRSPFNVLKICKSSQSSNKKILKYSGSPCNKFTIYSDTLDVQTDTTCRSSFDTVDFSDYEDDVFTSKLDVSNSDVIEKNSNIIQFYDSFENDDDEEGPWLPRKIFHDAEELHTLVRGYIQPKTDNLRISLSPISLPTRLSVGKFTLNISCGPSPSPEIVEIVTLPSPETVEIVI